MREPFPFQDPAHGCRSGGVLLTNCFPFPSRILHTCRSPDGVLLTNCFRFPSRILHTCRSDGVLLTPDRPAVPLDACWTSRDPGGELTWTRSDVEFAEFAARGASSSSPSAVKAANHVLAAALEKDFYAQPLWRRTMPFRYVLAAALEKDYAVFPKELDLISSSRFSDFRSSNSSASKQSASRESVFVAREWFSGEMRLFSAQKPLVLKSSVGGTGNPEKKPGPGAQDASEAGRWNSASWHDGWRPTGTPNNSLLTAKKTIQQTQTQTRHLSDTPYPSTDKSSSPTTSPRVASPTTSPHTDTLKTTRERLRTCAG